MRIRPTCKGPSRTEIRVTSSEGVYTEAIEIGYDGDTLEEKGEERMKEMKKN